MFITPIRVVIIPYIEPIYRFCACRLNSKYDAEDLASEIICHILAGFEKYNIESLNGWVWRVAHNRYARFVDKRRRTQVLYADAEPYDEENDDYCVLDEDEFESRYEEIFRCLHTLSSDYREMMVDYYIGDLPVKAIAAKYSLTETTVKWRLNVGRRKIRERI